MANKPVVNLKDLLSPDEKARVEQRYAERTSRSHGGAKVAPEVYITAKLGAIFGWPAIETIKRGYIESYEENSEGVFCRVLIPFTLEEALMLIDASDIIDNQSTARQQTANYYAMSAAFSKDGFRAFAKDNAERATANLEE